MKTQKHFPLIPLILSAVFFLGLLFVFLLLYRATGAKNEELKSKELKWQTEYQRREGIKEIDNLIQAVAAERFELETHFARSSDAVPFLDKLEELADKAGAEAEVTSVDIAPDQIGLLVGMKAKGTWSGLHKFLTLLENSPYELELERLDLNRAPKGEGSDDGAKWNAALRIKLRSFIIDK